MTGVFIRVDGDLSYDRATVIKLFSAEEQLADWIASNCKSCPKVDPNGRWFECEAGMALEFARLSRQGLVNLRIANWLGYSGGALPLRCLGQCRPPSWPISDDVQRALEAEAQMDDFFAERKED